MTDKHGTAIAVIEERPTEMMHPLVAAAVQAGTLDVASLERMMGLQERHEANEARKAFNLAMVELKRELPSVIAHDRTVDFTSGKGRTHYTHASLASVTNQVQPLLTKHGFSVSFVTEQKGNMIEVTCALSHEHGHSIKTALPGAPDNSGGKNATQAIASTVTYLRRYTLLSLLGIATADMGDPQPQQSDDERVDAKLNIGAAASLAKYGKTLDDAVEFLGKPQAEWTVADVHQRLAPWAKDAHTDVGPPPMTEDDYAELDQ